MDEKVISKINEFFVDIEFYYVGGCVRDIVLGHEPKDYDLITPLSPDEIESYIKSKGRKCFNIGKKFGTLGVKIEIEPKEFEMIEITTYRTETYEMVEKNGVMIPSRKPKVEFTTELMDDLKRRDFTINAMVMKPNGKILDYYNGKQDLKNKILKAVGIPKHRFKEDPLRILRAIRFSAKYDLSWDELTKKKAESCRFTLLDISRERIVGETTKIMRLGGDKTKRGLMLMGELKTTQICFPSLYLQWEFNQNSDHHDLTLWEHTVEVVVALSEKSLDSKKLWTALLHDIGKIFLPSLNKRGKYNYISHEVLGATLADEFCRTNKFSNTDREFIVESILNHLEEDSWLRVFDNKSKKKQI